MKAKLPRKGIRFNTGRTHIKGGQHLSVETEFKKGMTPWNKGIKKECETGTCLHCGSGFVNKRPYRTRKYCTRSCASKDKGFQKGRESWIIGKNKDELKKHYTNGWKGLFQKGQESPNKGVRYSKERIMSMSGENSPLWRGGVSPYTKRIRASRDFADWRKKVFERDDYTCQRCGNNGGKLHPHHIKSFTKYPSLRFETSNGSTLCVKCHRLFHRTYEKTPDGSNHNHFINSNS